jgi:hypothetical protein
VPLFPFPHLASLAGRAPIGGAREVALACFVAARLAADRTPNGAELPPPVLAARCAGAKAWLGTLALPAPVRGSVGRCVEASTDPEVRRLAGELSSLASAAAAYLDPAARSELETLAAALDR